MGTTTGMGTTSPLGTLSDPSASPASTGPSGIPLGATELNTPGVSPLQSPCPETASNSAFDGGGSIMSPACGQQTTSGAFGLSSAGASTASNADGSTMALGGSMARSGIPLGATGLGTPGESQNVMVPTAPVSPCTAQATGVLSNPATVANGC
jgi:hypothetical protein